MTNVKEAGSIHVQPSASLPAFLQFGADPVLKGWPVLRNVRSTLEAETAHAGWISFFMAGQIEKASFGFNRQKTLGAAMGRLATREIRGRQQLRDRARHEQAISGSVSRHGGGSCTASPGSRGKLGLSWVMKWI
jgi:hypothetical protein